MPIISDCWKEQTQVPLIFDKPHKVCPTIMILHRWCPELFLDHRPRPERSDRMDKAGNRHAAPMHTSTSEGDFFDAIKNGWIIVFSVLECIVDTFLSYHQGCTSCINYPSNKLRCWINLNCAIHWVNAFLLFRALCSEVFTCFSVLYFDVWNIL